MVTTSKSKQSLAATCSALITGLNSLTGADTVVSGGKTYTKAQLLAPLQVYVVLPTQTAAAKTAYTKAVAAEGDAKAAVIAMIEDVIKPYLQTRLGKTSPDLATYGLPPAKLPAKTAATKAEAAEKALATRKALGTKGPVQKKAAKKALEAQPAAPATSPAAPATPPAVAAPVKS
jgi:hypothetical protein